MRGIIIEIISECINVWEKELRIIKGLQKLYPELKNDWGNPVPFPTTYDLYLTDMQEKSWWLYLLCKYHLKQRIPSIENFMRKTNGSAWWWYSRLFGVEK